MAQGEVPLRRTPLYALHVRLGARMVPFAGYEMPLQYPGGIIAEHLHTRAAASLFDVSHMGQIAVRPRSGPHRGCCAGARDARSRRHPRARARTPALHAAHQRRGRRARRHHGVASARSSRGGGECRLQGGGRGASARASLAGTCEVEHARRPRAGGAAGAARGGGAGAARAGGERDAVHGRAADRHHGRATAS